MNLHTLCGQPESLRDQNWEKRFLDLFPTSLVEVVSADPVEGPDSWPYLQIKTSANAKEPVDKILSWLAQKGIGLVLNSHKQVPDYIFTYGMIWGAFQPQQQGQPPFADSHFEINEGEKIYFGAPSQEYWPNIPKSLFIDFLNQQGLRETKVLLISKNQIQYDLCFSLESLGSPPKHEHEQILQALSWFFPNNYQLALVSEVHLPPFYKLRVLPNGHTPSYQES